MINVLSNLRLFIVEVQNYMEAIKEEKDKVCLTLRRDILASPDEYFSFLRVFNALKKKYAIENYVKEKIITKPRLPGTKQLLEDVAAVQYHVDTIRLHSDIVRAYFKADFSKEDVQNSLSFLIQNGWTDKEFQEQIGLSRSTYFRYLPKNKGKTPLQEDQQSTVEPVVAA